MMLVFEDLKIVHYQLKGEIIILHSFFLCLKSWSLYSSHRECEWNVTVVIIQNKSTITQEQAVLFRGIPFYWAGPECCGESSEEKMHKEIQVQGIGGQGNASHCFLDVAVIIE